MKLPILSRFRSTGSSDPKQAEGERYTLAAEIPGLRPGKPLLRLQMEMHSEPQGDGERLRLRAHWQFNFASALAPALGVDPQPQANRESAERLPAERVGQWLRHRLDNPTVRRLAEPLLRHDFSSWLELRASTADLADGVGALLPETDKLKALGIEPKLSTSTENAPLAQSWAGSAGGPRPGFAQVSLLQMDKRHLPPALAALLGAKPFQLAAAMVNVVEEDPQAE
jgi:hypothetical protein